MDGRGDCGIREGARGGGVASSEMPGMAEECGGCALCDPPGRGIRRGFASENRSKGRAGVQKIHPRGLATPGPRHASLRRRPRRLPASGPFWGGLRSGAPAGENRGQSRAMRVTGSTHFFPRATRTAGAQCHRQLLTPFVVASVRVGRACGWGYPSDPLPCVLYATPHSSRPLSRFAVGPISLGRHGCGEWGVSARHSGGLPHRAPLVRGLHPPLLTSFAALTARQQRRRRIRRGSAVVVGIRRSSGPPHTASPARPGSPLSWAIWCGRRHA